VIELNGKKQAAPARAFDRGQVPWPEVIARAKRAATDCGMKVGEVRVGTTGDGMEAVFTLEVSGPPAPRAGTVHFGCVAGRPAYRAATTYGGVIQNGVPCVLGEYGSWSAKGVDNWGIKLDQCVHRFALDADSYRWQVDELRSRFCARKDFDAILYRAIMDGAVKPRDVQLLHAVRRPLEGETLWDAVRAVNACITRHRPIRYNPRVTQLGEMWKFTRELRETWEAREKRTR
jgi:hypothetical protein